MAQYESPLATRYASKELTHLFSSEHRAATWRKVWLALAEAEQELGLCITDAQLNELRATENEIDLEAVARWEKELRHDVMAHIHAWGEKAPLAKGILHLGATSCTITDNGDLLVYQDALIFLRKKLLRVIRQFAAFANQHKGLPTLGFTHFQPAQLTTVGKRAALWLYDLVIDFQELSYRLEQLELLGIKGTTGTQASFLALFNNDHEKVRKLEARVAELLGFKQVAPVSGQTYSRKRDSQILGALAGIASTAHKIGSDLRLLAHLKEIEEPFGKRQIGSSAMPYKRNPMKSERICSLARFVISLSENGHYTAATQWFERTLDDSANRRLSLPEAFLGIDGILTLLTEISDGLVVYPKVIAKRINDELPFMATENILMKAVEKGGDRQELHERIRFHSQEAAQQVKEEGKNNDLLDRLLRDSAFGLNPKELEETVKPESYIGCAALQVDDFLQNEVAPLLALELDETLSPCETVV